MPEAIVVPPSPPPPPFLTRFKGWIAGVMGVLVVMPALINAGIDVYASLLKIPKTEAERINERLFREYFGKQPVVTIPVPIKQNNGTVEVRFAVYDKGDVFVEFGSFTQWFPFPSRAGDADHVSSLSLWRSAVAQSAGVEQGSGPYQQTEQMKGGAIQRQRTYANGVIERQVIDPRSGEILTSSVQKSTTQSPAPTGEEVTSVQQVAPIDLDRYRQSVQAKPTGGAPSPGPNAANSAALQSALEWCASKDWPISRYICRYNATSKWCDSPTARATIPECKE